MIGFDLNGKAGKTAAETQREKEEAEYDEMLDRYIARFMEWADKTEQRAAETYEMQRNLYYAWNQNSWIVFGFVIVVCFALGWNAHAIFYQATNGGNLAEGIGNFFYRLIY